MWSVGVILYVLLSGSPPFTDENQSELFRKIRMGEWTFDGKEEWTEISEEAKDLIRGFLVTNPAQRLTAEQAMQCKWFKESKSGSDVSHGGGIAKQEVADLPKLTAKDAFDIRKSGLKNSVRPTKGKASRPKNTPSAEVSLDEHNEETDSQRYRQFEI